MCLMLMVRSMEEGLNSTDSAAEAGEDITVEGVGATTGATRTAEDLVEVTGTDLLVSLLTATSVAVTVVSKAVIRMGGGLSSRARNISSERASDNDNGCTANEWVIGTGVPLCYDGMP